MARFVIDTEAALRIAREVVDWAPHSFLAPTLLRSQVLDALYGQVRRGEIAAAHGLDLNARFGKLKIRYLGDAVLRRRAWAIASEADMASTAEAEFIALTQLQGDALVAENVALAEQARRFVKVSPFSALIE